MSLGVFDWVVMGALMLVISMLCVLNPDEQDLCEGAPESGARDRSPIARARVRGAD